MLKTITINDTIKSLKEDSLMSLYNVNGTLFFEDEKSKYVFDLYKSGYSSNEILIKINII